VAGGASTSDAPSGVAVGGLPRSAMAGGRASCARSRTGLTQAPL